MTDVRAIAELITVLLITFPVHGSGVRRVVRESPLISREKKAKRASRNECQRTAIGRAGSGTRQTERSVVKKRQHLCANL